MLIAITGHTSGLGKSIFDKTNSIGFSRSNGYDINQPQPIVEAAKNFDVFINNAYSGFAQVGMLYNIYESWKNQDKLIVNISSNSSDGIKNKIHPYAIHKAALDKASEQLSNLGNRCRVVNIKPGWIDTPRVSTINEKKIDTIQLSDFIINNIIYGKLNLTTVTILP